MEAKINSELIIIKIPNHFGYNILVKFALQSTVKSKV